MRRSERTYFCLSGLIFALYSLPAAAIEVGMPELVNPPVVAPPVDVVAQPTAAPSTSPPLMKSLFFTADELLALHRAMDGFSGSGAVAPDSENKDFISSLTDGQGDTPVLRSYTYPQFFLESLVYRSPADWSVRVNGQKYTQLSDVSTDEISVVSVDAKSVRLRWRPKDMAKILPLWQAKPNKEITFDGRTNTFEFSLYMNQTFSSHAMRVVEGKIVPIPESSNPAELPVEAAAPAAPVAPIPAPSTTTEENREGIRGLINAYDAIQQPLPPSAAPDGVKP